VAASPTIEWAANLRATNVSGRARSTRACAFHPLAIPIMMLMTNQLFWSITTGAAKVEKIDSHSALNTTAAVPPWARVFSFFSALQSLPATWGQRAAPRSRIPKPPIERHATPKAVMMDALRCS